MKPDVSGAGPDWAELIADAVERLRKAGVKSPRTDAELLAAHAIGVPWSKLPLFWRNHPDLQPRESFESFVRRREQRVPLQYVTGSAGFFGLDIEVQPGVFIPRYDTESLAAYVIERLREMVGYRRRNNGSAGQVCRVRVLDLCTGSGAIGLAIAHELPEAWVVAVDVCSRAAALAKKNADRLGLGERFVPLVADLDKALRVAGRRRFDAMVANPPYVPDAQISELEPEVGSYEPLRALRGGPDGLQVVRRVLSAAPRVLNEGGFAAVELGDGQIEALLSDTTMRQELRAGGVELEGVVEDLSDTARFVVVSKVSKDLGLRSPRTRRESGCEHRCSGEVLRHFGAAYGG